MAHALKPRLVESAGLTLVDLIITFAIVAVLATLVAPVVFSNCSICTRERSAKLQLQAIGMATHLYITDWGSFPPQNSAPNTRTGSELLHRYLCKRYVINGKIFGPYFPLQDNVHTGDGMDPALVSPLDGYYSFGFEGTAERRNQWVLMDSGRDKLLGGTMDNEKGFVPDNSDANGDGKPDHLDNIIEKVSLR